MVTKPQVNAHAYPAFSPGTSKTSFAVKSQYRRRPALSASRPGLIDAAAPVKRRQKSLCGARAQLVSDQRRRSAYSRDELRRTLTRSYVNCDAVTPNLTCRLTQVPGAYRFGFTQMLSHSLHRATVVRYGCLSRVRNRCVLSGHSRALRGYALSRIAFRTVAGRGLVPGLRKI